MTLPARPASVPSSAEYLRDTKQWSDGPRVDGKKQGLWRFWRQDGSLQEECEHQDDLPHGRAVRYHPDGSRSAEQQCHQGQVIEVMLHLTDKPTDEDNPRLPPAIRKMRVLFEDGWQKRIQFFDAADLPLTVDGRPAPTRPAGLPEDAYLTDDVRTWKTGLFKNERTAKGLHRFWTLEGELVTVAYHSGNRRSADSRLPDVKRNGSLLVHATELGDTEAVEALLALGFGHEPGAALDAALAGQPELAKRLLALPPGEPFHPRGEHTRPGALPAEAVWVPTRQQWVVGTVDAEQGPVGTWTVWWITGEAEDGTLKGGLEVVEFQGGRTRHKREYRPPGEHGELKEETWFDEAGRQVRRRSFDRPEGFTELESLPSGESIKRQGKLPDRIWSEEHWDAEDELVSVRYFDDEGRLRTELVSSEGHGRVFDEHGTVVAEGAVEGERLTGTWKLHGGDAEARELDVGGLSLEASVELGTLLPLISRMQEEPVPAFLEQAMDLEWADLKSHFNLDPEQVPGLLRVIALDTRAAVEHGLRALGDDLYHQGTLSELAGPVLPFLCAITSHMKDEETLEQLLTFLSDVGTRGYNLDAANTLKKAFRQRKGALEPGHGLFFHALVEHAEAWVRLSRHANPSVCEPATVLLGLTDDARAASALCVLLEGRAGTPSQQALAARMLSLHPAKDASRAALERALGSEDGKLRSEAAKSWLRLHLPHTDRAVAVLLEQVRAGKAEAAVILTLLPAGERARHQGVLIQALLQADLSTVYGVARAALSVTREKGADAEPSAARREVLEALLANKRFWRLDVNAAEVLREVGLPTTRAGLEALLRGAPVDEVGARDGFLSAASGIDGPSVESFREEDA
ncbi:hypothetical protein [Pyxidicoccus trucidator]|uniref:hypothetical protein n=1 Tax=Pyxidicoccus trucidator TaxID=2709662 RepID=UPI0013DA913E|nr:hypothetical protein [Pyxidicoccus trucidator]